jgi:hypothetical protein
MNFNMANDNIDSTVFTARCERRPIPGGGGAFFALTMLFLIGLNPTFVSPGAMGLWSAQQKGPAVREPVPADSAKSFADTKSDRFGSRFRATEHGRLRFTSPFGSPAASELPRHDLRSCFL